MQTLVRTPNKVLLNKLQLTFPALWANHKEHFHLFFNAIGQMNELGYFTYDTLKKSRRKRINHQTKHPDKYIWSRS